MTTRQRYTGSASYYVDGNTVRRINANTYRAVQREERIAEQKKRRERMERRHTVRRNQEKALSMDLGYVFALAAAGLVTLFLCLNYIQMQSAITTRMNHIEKLELQLEHTKAENDELQTRIDTYVDLDYVKYVATAEMGMVYANQSQILLYDKTESEYVRQNEDIPEH